MLGGIYKSYSNESAISYLNSLPSPLSFILPSPLSGIYSNSRYMVETELPKLVNILKQNMKKVGDLKTISRCFD